MLEIGTGWGGLALHAAREHGCRVTTTTISREQHDMARARVRAAGLEHRIDVIFEDYRDLRGSYDKLVSIEMLEAVGAQYLRDYFQQCARLLKPDGLLLVQSIVIADHAFAHASTDVDFLKKYIFPGSCLPSVGAIAAASGTTDLRTLHVEDIGPHYCLTLRRWREAFRRNLDRVRALGFDARFVRMWDYYFSYCEGVFSTHHTSDVQWLWGKPGFTAPLPAVVPEGTVAWRAH